MSLNQSGSSTSRNVPEDILDGIFSDKDKDVEVPCPMCGCTCKTGRQRQKNNIGTADNNCTGFSTRENGKHKIYLEIPLLSE